MSDPEKEDELKYMKTMFTDDLRFMHRMIKRAKEKLIKEILDEIIEFKKRLNSSYFTKKRFIQRINDLQKKLEERKKQWRAL